MAELGALTEVDLTAAVPGSMASSNGQAGC
jgi:hypothetical protein